MTTCKKPDCSFDDDSVNGYCSLYCKWTDKLSTVDITPSSHTWERKSDEPPTEARRIAEELARDFALELGRAMPTDDQASRHDVRGGRRLVNEKFAVHVTKLLRSVMYLDGPADWFDNYAIGADPSVRVVHPQMQGLRTLGVKCRGGEIYVSINGIDVKVGERLVVTDANGGTTSYRIEGLQGPGGVWCFQVIAET